MQPETGGDRMIVKSGNIEGSTGTGNIEERSTNSDQNENRTQTGVSYTCA